MKTIISKNLVQQTYSDSDLSIYLRKAEQTKKTIWGTGSIHAQETVTCLKITDPPFISDDFKCAVSTWCTSWSGHPRLKAHYQLKFSTLGTQKKSTWFLALLWKAWLWDAGSAEALPLMQLLKSDLPSLCEKLRLECTCPFPTQLLKTMHFHWLHLSRSILPWPQRRSLFNKHKVPLI